MPVEAELVGDEEALALLTRMQLRVRNLRDPLDDFGDYYAAFHTFRFARSGSFVGTKRWAPLNPRYKAWKTARYGPLPILTRSGDLARSLSSRPFDIDRVTNDSATFGTTVKYATFHQTGTRFMPKRVVIGPLPPALLSTLEKLIADHILPMDEVRSLRRSIP